MQSEEAHGAAGTSGRYPECTWAEAEGEALGWAQPGKGRQHLSRPLWGLPDTPQLFLFLESGENS